MRSMQALVETNLPNPFHRGKVRDMYDLGGGHLLMVATDRISAFDVVLPTPIPEKGEVLSRIAAFWFRRTAPLVPNHLVGLATDTAALSGIALPAMSNEVARRASVVRRARRLDVECIARGYITGSAWAEYRRSGTVHGSVLPAGLLEASKLPEPRFTPTTKAEEGHDEPLTAEQLVALVGADVAKRLEETTLAVYNAADAYARSRGIIIADTKLEFGMIEGELTVIDELLTPDSSRFWDAATYAPGGSPPNFDKQFVRDWLTEAGWDREPPAPELPAEIVEKTRTRYQQAYERLTDESFR